MKDTIYLGVKGSIVAIDRASGKEFWRTKLKGGDFVVAILDGDRVLAHTKGELFAVDAKTGELLWNNPLTGLGYGYATVTSANVSPDQAVAVIQQLIAQQQAAAANAGVVGAS